VSHCRPKTVSSDNRLWPKSCAICAPHHDLVTNHIQVLNPLAGLQRDARRLDATLEQCVKQVVTMRDYVGLAECEPEAVSKG
jgi:hypothetical protein